MRARLQGARWAGRRGDAGVPALLAPGVAVETGELLGLRGLAAAQPAGLRQGGSVGAAAGRRRGAGLELDGARPWVIGDDARHLAASVTARSGAAHIRLFREEPDRTTLLAADFRGSMLFGTRGALRSVAAARALALAGWRAALAGERVGLVVIGDAGGKAGDEAAPVWLRPRRGEQAMPAVIGALAAAHRRALERPAGADDPPLDEALRVALRRLPSGGCLVLASALESPGPGLSETLAEAAAKVGRRPLQVLLVADAFESRAPAGRYVYAGSDGVRRRASVRADAGPEDAMAARLAALGLLGRPAVRIVADDDAEAMLGKLLASDVG